METADDSHLRETRIDGELAYDGHFLKVTRDRIRLPDGKESAREFIRHPGAVVILPLLGVLEKPLPLPATRVTGLRLCAESRRVGV